MEFTFNNQKNTLNKHKHGIDFIEARALWGDPDRVEIPSRFLDEPRQLLIGMIGSTCWSAIFIYRKGKIRIISVRRSRRNEKNTIKAKDFDEKFDRGQDVYRFLDLSKAARPGREQKRVNVDFPTWMIQSLDREAKRLGVTRQSAIKVWIAERLQSI